MSWDDIDFDFIKSNYITRGPAEVSFGDYLNQFATAAKEKINMLLIFSSQTLPTYEFGPNHIRNLGSGVNTFWSQYQEMISDYADIWNNYKWFSSEVLTDTGSPDQYRLTDIDLTDIITIPTWDIINNTGRSNKEAFTADVLNALYEIYKLTQFQEKPILTQNVQNGNASGFFPGVPGDFDVNRVTKSRTPGSYYGKGDTVARLATDTLANDFAYADMFGDWSQESLFIGSDDHISTILFGIVKIGLASPAIQWECAYSGVSRSGYPPAGVQDGSIIYCYYKDLLGADLEMDMSIQLSVKENFKSYRFDTGGASTTVQLGAYDVQWPNVGLGGGAHLDKAIPQSVNHGSAFGSQYIYAYNPNGGATPWLQEAVEGVIPGGATDNFREDHRLNLQATNRAFVDLNNIGLEFYIAP